MKSEGGLVVSLSSELASYFKSHPGDLPLAVDVNALEIKCSSYLIEHIESYTAKPFTDKFLWSLTFPNSKFPRFQYLYFITYKAKYMGECGVVTANLISENQEDPDAWYLSN